MQQVKAFNKKRKVGFKSVLELILVIVGLIMVLSILFPFSNSEGNNGTKANTVFEEDDGLIIFNPVNFRKTAEQIDGNIICQIKFGEKVQVVEKGEKWTKIIYNGDEGFVTNEAVSDCRLMFDLSDFNWGSEYSSVEEFEAFIDRAQKSCKFGGLYLQVQRGGKENKHWRELVHKLDEMEVPYGLYLYSASKTKEAAKEDYESFLSLLEGEDLKYNLYPIMVDLEGKGNQIDALKFYAEEVDDYIVYANASDMRSYKYHEISNQIWIAHYGLVNSVPYKSYEQYSDNGIVPDIWQYTDDGAQTLFGTRHLDINLVSDEFYSKYVE